MEAALRLEWWDADPVFSKAVLAGLAFAASAALGGLLVKSPYGKLSESSAINVELLNLDPRLGWLLMELPATLSFWFFYLVVGGPGAREPLPMLLAALWALHYGNRGFFFPLSIRVAPGKKSSFSLTVVTIGWLFTALHGYLNATWYTRIGTHLFTAGSGQWPVWVSSPVFLSGLLLYQFSFWATVHSEYIQRNLRSAVPSKDEPQYKIPRGGFFELVTSPTYFFELLGWLAFGLMTLNPGGLVVFCVSAANLVPRAFQQHEWYLRKFDEYHLLSRRALIPFVI